MENESEHNSEHYKSLSHDPTRRRKFYITDQALKIAAEENPDLKVSYNKNKNQFEFIFPSLSDQPFRLPINYDDHDKNDKHFLLKSMLNEAYNLGFEAKGKEVHEKLKNLLEL